MSDAIADVAHAAYERRSAKGPTRRVIADGLRKTHVPVRSDDWPLDGTDTSHLPGRRLVQIVAVVHGQQDAPFGLSVAESQQSCMRCMAAGRSSSARDVFGHHALCCMLGTDRCSMHNAIVNTIFADASFGLLHPVREAHPFAENDRLDIVLRRGNAEELVDVAVTCPFRQGALAAAAAKAGGAATAYEAVKVTAYSKKIRALQELVPLIFDTFVGVGESGRPFLARVANAFARRFGASEARSLFYTTEHLDSRAHRYDRGAPSWLERYSELSWGGGPSGFLT